MIIIFIVFVLLAVCIAYFFPLIQIVGRSMYPTYKDGEFYLGTRLFRKSKIKRGDVILYKHSDRIVIKRVSKIKEEKGELLFYFLGDNSMESYDSREYGFVSSKYIICKIIKQKPRVPMVNL